VTVYAGKDRFQIEYHLVNRGKDDVVLCFGIEFNLAFLSGSDDDRYYVIPGRELEDRRVGSAGLKKRCQNFSLVDRRRNLSLALCWSRPALLWRMPVEAISLSEGGLERSYQQSASLAELGFLPGPR